MRSASLGENRSAEEKSTGVLGPGRLQLRHRRRCRCAAISACAIVQDRPYSDGLHQLRARGSMPMTVETLLRAHAAVGRTSRSSRSTTSSCASLRREDASRGPRLPALTPGGTIDIQPPGFSINSGNPFLEPIRVDQLGSCRSNGIPMPRRCSRSPSSRRTSTDVRAAPAPADPLQRDRLSRTRCCPRGVDQHRTVRHHTFLNTPGGKLAGFEVTAADAVHLPARTFDRLRRTAQLHQHRQRSGLRRSPPPSAQASSRRR